MIDKLIMGSIQCHKSKDYDAEKMINHYQKSVESKKQDKIKKARKPPVSKAQKLLPTFEDWKDDDFYFSKKHTPTKPVRCAKSHPVLNLGAGREIQGGSCTDRVPVGEYDVFIGLEGSFRPETYPWNKDVEFLFRIPDMGVPPKLEEFKKLITYIITSLDAGKSVFVGCIGGHGRTGLVLAVLVKECLGIVDSTTYIRKHYCKKAVESIEQIDWLTKHYGITPVEPTKTLIKSYKSKNSGSYIGWSGGDSLELESAPIACMPGASGRLFSGYTVMKLDEK